MIQTKNNINIYPGIYRGKVVETGSAGKCKIYVPAIYDPSYESNEKDALPWAEPAQPLFAGCTDGNGMFQLPLVGSMVWVFFEGCDHNRPVFFAATLGGTTAASNFIDDKYIIKTKTSTITIDDTSGAINIDTDTSHTTTVPTITINASSTVIINSPAVTLNSAAVSVNSGTITVTGGDVIADGISLKTHVHAQNNGNDLGGGVNTTPPVG